AADAGPRSFLNTAPVVGDPLPEAIKLEIVPGIVNPLPSGTRWALHGVTSLATCATPRLRKQTLNQNKPESADAKPFAQRSSRSEKVSQDERRQIFEESSHHIQKGLAH